ncbi:hypothetical protein OEZ86_005607 [Tetradesmus obliquus]|nr:hypothetical protein OEZ86_005607 [Tetradesmus obliquus]
MGPSKAVLSDEYLMQNYKVTPCTRKYPHDWAQCPCGHKGERASRRPLSIGYSAIGCNYAKQRLPCPRGEQCPYAHNLFEYYLHPQRFRTELCQYGTSCKRSVCFFAHTLEQMRPLDPSLPPPETCCSSSSSWFL